MIEPCATQGTYVTTGNRWDLLPVPAVGELVPDLSMSVIIPAKDQPLLTDVVELLADQSYPDELVEIIVVDDGSEHPLDPSTLSDRIARRVQVIHHESAGFGAGAARRAGAAAARNEILAFVDSDLRVPFDYLEAHARWHHVAPNAVVVGEVRMLAKEGVASEQLRSRSQAEWRPVEWVTRYLDRTDLLRDDHQDIWSVTTGASVSVRRPFYQRFGGFAGLGIRGVEDIEFGYRAYAHGGMIIPEKQGFGWHPPERFFDDPARGAAAKQRRTEILADRVPTSKTRPSSSRRIRSVPDVVVNAHVPSDGSKPADALLEVVDRFLVMSAPTTELVLHGLQGRPDLPVLLDGIVADPRVRAAEPGRKESELAPRVAFCDLEDLPLVRRLLSQQMQAGGLVGATHADRRPTVVVPGRALHRATMASGGGRISWPAEEVFRLIDRLFGGDWSDASIPSDTLPKAPPTSEMSASSTTGDPSYLERIAELEADLQRVRAEHQRLRSRRIVRLTNKLGSLRRRTPS